jgi:hypothetical protein
MPSVVCPSATRATTVATGILRPRSHGTPPNLAGIGRDLLEFQTDSVARRPLIREGGRSGSRVRHGHQPESRARTRP